MSNPIKGFRVMPSYAEGKCYLSWNAHVTALTLQKSRNGISGWSVLATLPVGSTSYVDNGYVVKNKVIHYFYRLVDEFGTTTASTNAYTLTDLSQNGIINYIINEELLHMRSGNGVPVAILSKNTDTGYCPDCRDADTGQVLNTHCQTCGGTGRLGGYSTPIQTYAVRLNPTQLDTSSAAAPNQTEKVVYEFRAVNIPEIKEQDILVNKVTDDRYIVDALVSFDFRGSIPIIVTLKTSLLSRDNPVYTVAC